MKIFFLLIAIHSIQSYPYFPLCSSEDQSDSVVLSTLNGNIEGACYNVTVNYASRPLIYNQVMTWLSVPYAEPPVKKHRFKSPRPIRSWNETKLGTEWPKPCLQEFGKSANKNSEDCLYLNIFVPLQVYLNRNNSQAPIYVYIHGGSLTGGQTAMDRIEPSTLVASTNIIVITIQYRLSSFGFLYISGTEAQGNQAIQDQNLALKWVYKNAKFFGGDNKRITIGGESAGAMSVAYHLIYKPSWPYFRNAIMESSAFLEVKSKKLISPEEATKNAFKIGDLLGCNNNGSNQELFECIQSAHITESKQAFKKYFVFPPIVNDGKDFAQDPEKLIQSLDMKPANIMIGSNTKDRGFFFKKEIKDETKNGKQMTKSQFVSSLNSTFKTVLNRYELNKIDDMVVKLLELYNGTVLTSNSTYLEYLIQILSDERYKCPAKHLSEAYSKLSNVNVFTYLYGYRISTSGVPSKYEAIHEDELPMVYGEPLSVKKLPLLTENIWSSTGHNYSVAERLISEQIMNYWSNFVAHDNPNGKSQEKWLKFNKNRSFLYINADQTQNMQYSVYESICSFFNT